MSKSCCNANGWIVEGGMVVDRCAICNPPPRRPAPTWLERNGCWVFPIGLVAGLIASEFAALSIFYHR